MPVSYTHLDVYKRQGIDSDRQETSEFAPFLNIMNELFVRDTSKKIKAVLKSRGSSGNAHTSNIPPYGYLKDPENHDHWIIDEDVYKRQQGEQRNDNNHSKRNRNDVWTL